MGVCHHAEPTLELCFFVCARLCVSVYRMHACMFVCVRICFGVHLTKYVTWKSEVNAGYLPL